MLVLLILLVVPATALARRRQHPKLGPWVSVTLTRPDLSAAALKPMGRVRFSSARTHERTLDVNPSVHYQKMIGFGGAMTDASAWLLNHELAPGERAAVMRSLFSSSGIHLGFVRVPIGASDFTARGIPYSYDDLPAGRTDPWLAHFSIAHDRAYVIPALRDMLRVNPHVDVLASEWSAPAWMKANGALDNRGFRGVPLPDYYESLALYFVRFIDEYRAAGIPIWGVTPQNEPYSPAPYPGMTFTPETEAQFVSRNLAPTLAAAHLHTWIFGGDDTQLPLAEHLMQSDAARYLAGIAWHCYQGQTTMSRFHQLYPSTVNLVSECSPGLIPYGAAEVAIDGARNWSSAINLWNLALDPKGGPVQPPNQGCHSCSGLVTVSEARHSVSYTRSYYELGQISKFVHPGAVRIHTQRWVSDYRVPTKRGRRSFGVTEGLDDVAFRNPDGSFVLICHENSSAPVSFGVQSGGLRFRYTLPGSATVTFTWR